MTRKNKIVVLCAIAAVALCAVVLIRFGFWGSDPAPEITAETEETTVPAEIEAPEPKAANLLTITILYPDGTAYESTDDGETWFADGEPTEKPTLSAFFIGDIPVLLSEGCRLYVYNDTETELYYGQAYELLLERSGEWFPAARADGGESFFTQELLTLPKRVRRRFNVPTEDYKPIAGQYRYIREFNVNAADPDDGTYTVILEFTAAEAPQEP